MGPRRGRQGQALRSFVLLDQAPGSVVVTGVGPTLRARLGVRLVQEFVEGGLAGALQGASFFETAMPTLLHGPLPVDVCPASECIAGSLALAGVSVTRRWLRCGRCPPSPGGSRPSSTRSTPGPSPTPTATGSATSRASGATSTTWTGWASTPSGSRRSSAPPWPTSATTSATTATSTRCSARWPTSTACWPTPTPAGMRVIIDWVPNHIVRPSTRGSSRPGRAATTRSGTGTSGATRRPTARRPTTGRRPFRDEPAWTLDQATGQYYLHLFLPEQPDLNWANPEVEAAMHDALRFWLDRGVDGFRIDVIHAIGKDPALPDDPPDVAAHPPLRAQRHARDPRARCAASATLLDGYDGDRMWSARCSCSTRPRWPPTTATATSCTSRSTSRRCSRRGRPHRWARQLDDVADPHRARRAGRPGCCRTTTCLRHRTRYGSEARARAAAVLCSASGARRSSTPARSWARGRRGPARAGRRPGRARRLPGPDPVGRAAPATAGATPTRGCPGRPTPRPATSRRSGTTRRRSSTSTGAAGRPAGVAGAAARRPGAPRRARRRAGLGAVAGARPPARGA